MCADRGRRCSSLYGNISLLFAAFARNTRYSETMRRPDDSNKSRRDRLSVCYHFTENTHPMYGGESRDSLFTALVPFSRPPFIPSEFLMKDKHNQSHRGRKREYYIGWPCNFVAAGGGPALAAPGRCCFRFIIPCLAGLSSY